MFLVDRQRHWLMVEWALWLNMKDDITYKLACEWRAFACFMMVGCCVCT